MIHGSAALLLIARSGDRTALTADTCCMQQQSQQEAVGFTFLSLAPTHNSMRSVIQLKFAADFSCLYFQETAPYLERVGCTADTQVLSHHPLN